LRVEENRKIRRIELIEPPYTIMIINPAPRE
jgi:hypothetical protein